MPRSLQRPNTLSSLVRLLAFLALWPLAAQGQTMTITDAEGFGPTLTAFTLDLPAGWTGAGRVMWNKPCSGNDLYEISASARSADGQSGLRMQPGHLVQWNETSVDATIDPALAQLALAQAEALKNEMRTAFKGSNCHLAQVQGSPAEVTAQVLRALILSKRPAGARVTAMRPNDAVLALYKATEGPPMAGFFSRHDAQIIDLAYDGPNGAMVERLFLAWFQYGTDPAAPSIPGIPTIVFQTLLIDTLTFVHAPAARAADLDAGEAALRTLRTDPVWQEELRKVQAKRTAQQQQAQKDRSEAFDRQHKAFLETIMQ